MKIRGTFICSNNFDYPKVAYAIYLNSSFFLVLLFSKFAISWLKNSILKPQFWNYDVGSISLFEKLQIDNNMDLLKHSILENN